MTTAPDCGPGDDTLLTAERQRGQAGPPPPDERTEIRWERCEGTEVVVKAASDHLRERLRRESEVLRRAEGLPVAELFELVEAADHTELVTVRYGPVTIAEIGLLDPTERGAALGAMCRAVDELHSGGWAHGALEPSHVLVDPGAGVALCSLASATEVDGQADPSVATDREALAALVIEALTEPAGFDSRRARRRWNAASRRAGRRLRATRGLRTGAAILEVLRSSGVPGIDTQPRPTDRVRRPNRIVVAVAATLVAIAGAGVTWSLAREAPVSDDSCRVWVDVDDDGTCDEVAVEGRTIKIDDLRFEVGEPGDVPQLGDWHCDGSATVTLLRPSTGQLFGFDRWPGSGGSTPGRLIGTIEGATSLATPSGCGPVQVVLEDGSVLEPLQEGGGG